MSETAAATFRVMWVTLDVGPYAAYNQSNSVKVSTEDEAHRMAAELSVKHVNAVVSVFPPNQGDHSSYVNGEAMRLHGELV